MDLMKKEVRDELFNPKRPIYTKVRDDAPSRYGLESKVKNSIIAQGCVIDGEVENCVISKGVYVGKGAKLSNCIVMQDTKIGTYTNLNYVIIDKDVQIKDGRSLMGFDSYPSFLRQRRSRRRSGQPSAYPLQKRSGLPHCCSALRNHSAGS